jgi:putative oxidoreductase
MFTWLIVLGIKFYLAWVFGKAAWAKLTDDPGMIGAFEVIGLGQRFRYITGTIEGLAVLLILTPFAATVSLGALLLSATMAGAIYAHTQVFKDGDGWHRPAVLLFLSLIVLGFNL